MSFGILLHGFWLHSDTTYHIWSISSNLRARPSQGLVVPKSHDPLVKPLRKEIISSDVVPAIYNLV